jgi:hypothetical protein
MVEFWKDIEGYEGFYQISNLGRVKALPNSGTGRRPYERILKDCDSGHGYKYVSLTNGVKRKNNYIHRLIANAFLSNPKNLPQVNHIGGNKSNNVLTNLEWIDLTGNMQHAYSLGLIPRGEKNHLSKLSESQVREIRILYDSGVHRETVKALYNISFPQYHRIGHRKLWKHII